MATANLSANPRTATGKGAARTLRQSGRIPGIIYGHAREPQALTLDAREFGRLMEHVTASTVIELDVSGKKSSTLIREIQRHPYRREVLHVDFLELVAGEKVTVEIPIVYIGTPAGVRDGGILEQIRHELTVEADPTTLPEHIEVDVSELTIGHTLYVRDVRVPIGATVQDDPDSPVALVAAPVAEPTPVEAMPVIEGAVPEAAPEPELIRRPKEGEEQEE
ncbi:MAG: 50S ribosomal protein L25 [Gemmatimonadota bacterium]|nr:50S ribosomal protein L25 [Gemmatimonadota bacterium]